MDISKVKLDDEHHALLLEVGNAMIETQRELHALQGEYQEAIEQLNIVKAKIKPLKERLSPLAEMQASIASRKSRVKYFPEFATRNYDDSKDKEFLEFVKKNIPRQGIDS
jgi:predicted  nucleic acid-binding Zn-ribbon protein